jgi:hypothetical protein
MRSIPARICLVVLAGSLMSSGAFASVTTLRHAQTEVILQEQNMSDARSALASLRQDVGQHPADFIAFETRISAERFIEEHEGAYRETERRVILRGVVGYWQGKTLVVLPSVSMEFDPVRP